MTLQGAVMMLGITLAGSLPLLAGEGCSSYAKTDQQRGPAVVFGDAFNVPLLRFRFVDAAGNPHVPKTVDIHYYWQWLEYPYPEHSWGAWSDAEEWVRCTPLANNELVVSGQAIKPRGWYDGKYTHFPWARRPRFDRLEVVVENGSAARIKISKSDLERYRGSTAVVKLSNGTADVSFVKAPR